MKTNLFHSSDSHTWHLFRWPEFKAFEPKEKYLIIQPVCSLSDWGLGFPLDSEEVVTLSILKKGLEDEADDLKILVLPPFRFGLGPYEYNYFNSDPDLAHNTLADIAKSVKMAGFSKLLFLNSNPWDEPLVDSAGRDIRIELGLQMFCINLASLGLDFHPTRPDSRKSLQLLLTYLLQKEGVVNGKTNEAPPEFPFRPGHNPVISGEKECPSLETANEEAPGILSETSTHLLELLKEIDARPPLPNDGKITSQ